MADIKFLCPSCERKLAIDERGAGMLVKCPDCATVVTVPRQSTITTEPRPTPPPPAAPAPTPAPSAPNRPAPPAYPRPRPAAPPPVEPAPAPSPVKPAPVAAPDPTPVADSAPPPPAMPPATPPAPDPVLAETIRSLTAQRDEQATARRAAEQERDALRTRLAQAEAALAANTTENTSRQRDHETALAAAAETRRIDQERWDTEREAATAERLRLETQLAKLTTDYQTLSATLDQTRQQANDLEARLASERTASTQEQSTLRHRIETERDTALAQVRDTEARCETLTAERDSLAALATERQRERDVATTARSTLEAQLAERDAALSKARTEAAAHEATHQQALAAAQAAHEQALEDIRRTERDAAAIALAAEKTARTEAEAALLRERTNIEAGTEALRRELAAVREERDTLLAERDAARKVEAKGADAITTGEARAYRDPFRLLLRRFALYAGGALTLLGLAAAYIAWTSDEPEPTVLATPSAESLRAVLADDTIEAQLGTPALIDELEITLSAPRVGPVTLVSMLGTETESSEWYLVFDVTVVNRSDAETILYQPWSNALITDANKRKLRPALLGQHNAMHDVKDRLVTHTLAPGETVTDRMVFPWRETEADHYTLTVDPDARRINLDERTVQLSFSSLRLDLPRTAIAFP